MADNLRWSESVRLGWGVAANTHLSLAERSDHTRTITNQLQIHIRALLVSGKRQLSHIWWQALSQNLTLILVCTWAAHYFIYHFRPYFFPALHARLSHSLGKPTLTKMSEKHMLLESFFEKGKRSNDETAGD